MEPVNRLPGTLNDARKVGVVRVIGGKLDFIHKFLWEFSDALILLKTKLRYEVFVIRR